MNPANAWWGKLLPSISYSYISAILMIFVFFKDFSEHNQNSLLKSPPFKWIYLLLICYVLVSYIAVFQDIHLDATFNFFKLVVIISIAYKLVNSEQKLDYTILGYVIGAFYISFIVYQSGRNYGLRVEGLGPVDSMDGNNLAAAIAPALIFCVYFIFTLKSKINKIFYIFAGIFITNALILINSRGAILGSFCGLIFYLFRLYSAKQKKPQQRKMVLVLFVFGLLGTSVIIDDNFIKRFETIKNTKIDYEKETGTTRFAFWLAAIDMSLDKPFGVGARGFELFSDTYLPVDINTGKYRTRAVHSIWFEALSEIGYIGFFSLIFLIISCFQTLKLCSKKLLNSTNIEAHIKILSLESALLTFLIISTFINRLRAETLYWLILFIACAYNIYVLQKNSSSTDK